MKDFRDMKDLKGIYETGKNFVKEAVSVAKEKELRDKMVRMGSSLAKETALMAADLSKTAVQKTKEYAAEKHIGSKNEYIEELERKLEEKEKEIKILKRRLARECWKKQKRE